MQRSVQGLEEELLGIQRLANDVMEVVFDTLESGSELVLQDIRNYPPEREITNPYCAYVRGVGTVSLKTGKVLSPSENYGPTTTLKMNVGSNYVESVFSSPASYASYVRGNLAGYVGPAWMHKGIWDNLTEITGDNVPKIEQKLDSNLADKFQELCL